MSFSVIEPGRFVTAEGLGEGQCAIDKTGTATFRADDLDRAGIADRAIVLADPETLRIAVRRPRDEEAEKTVSVMPVMHDGKRSRGKVRLLRAIEAIGLESVAVRGRYELLCKGKDGDALLIVPLIRPGEGDAESAADKIENTE